LKHPYFLLVADDMFKRKLVRHASATLAEKKITVTVLEAIGRQIEQFIMVQIFAGLLFWTWMWGAGARCSLCR
jgi:hypothetical protein